MKTRDKFDCSALIVVIKNCLTHPFETILCLSLSLKGYFMFNSKKMIVSCSPVSHSGNSTHFALD